MVQCSTRPAQHLSRTCYLPARFQRSGSLCFLRLPGWDAQVTQVAWATQAHRDAAPSDVVRHCPFDSREVCELHAHGGDATAVFPDQDRAVVGGRGQRARIWDVASCAVLYEFVAPSEVSSLAVASGGALVWVQHGTTATVWELATGRVVQSLITHPTMPRYFRMPKVMPFAWDDRVIVSGPMTTVAVGGVDSSACGASAPARLGEGTLPWACLERPGWT